MVGRVLEGLGAALILPAIVALVASNFNREERPRAYGLVAAAAAIAVAVGPIVGGLFTTYLSWRYVFAGEVLIVIAILALARRIEVGAPEREGAAGPGRDCPLGPRPGAGRDRHPPLRDLGAGQGQARRAGMDRALAGGLADPRRCGWCSGCSSPGRPALAAAAASRWSTPAILRIPVLRGGLTSFFFQYFLQGGLFFAVPLFLSIALGLSAIETGVRLLPLSFTLILAAAGIPRLFPEVSPRRVVRLGFLAMFAGLVVMVAALDAGAGPEIVTWPMLLAGLGIGSLASQLGSITVSSVPDEQSGEVGGLQNTVTNLGISVGTALTGAIVIAALSSSFLTGVEENPAVPASVKTQVSTELSGGVPFLSDKELEAALEGARCHPEPARRSSKRTKPRDSTACVRLSPFSPSSPWLASSTPAGSRSGSRPRGRRGSPRRTQAEDPWLGGSACDGAGPRGILASGLLALGLVEHDLAQADRLGGDFDALVLAQELQRPFQ